MPKENTKATALPRNLKMSFCHYKDICDAACRCSNTKWKCADIVLVRQVAYIVEIANLINQYEIEIQLLKFTPLHYILPLALIKRTIINETILTILFNKSFINLKNI